MKKIFILIISVSFYVFASESKDLTPYNPIEIGIISFDGNKENLFSIYMINQEPVSGIQLDLDPQNFFIVESVYGGSAEKNGFSLHHNKDGRILAFSMSGKTIPKAKSLNKEDNILFNVLFSYLPNASLSDTSITIIPIFSDDKANRMNYISIPYQIGK